jgi:hypothetical protein
VASVATVSLVFLGLDPLCWFGCRTVKALAAEHHAYHDVPLAFVGSECTTIASKLAALVGRKVDAPHFCSHCSRISCDGGESIRVGEGACLIRLKRDGRVISFFQAHGVHVHPMLRGQDGLYVAREGDCTFVGWREDAPGDDKLCAVIADTPAVPLEELVAVAAIIRMQEQASH